MAKNVFTKSTSSLPCDKRKNKYQNDTEDEDGDDEETIRRAQKNNINISRMHNHIYFRSDVTMKSVQLLCDLIDEYNREQEILKIGNTTGIIVSRPIYLHISSLGGDLLAGFMAYDYIRNSKIPVYTIADGYAVSSGANMFMAGKKRMMTKNSYILIHQLNITKQGTETYHDMMDNASNIIEFMSRLYAIYLNNLRYSKKPENQSDVLTKKKIENHMLHDIYWNIETCMMYGLVDGEYTGYADADNDDTNYLLAGTAVPMESIKTYTLEELVPSKSVIEAIKEKHKQQQNVLELVKDFIKKRKTVQGEEIDDVINENCEKDRKKTKRSRSKTPYKKSAKEDKRKLKR